MFVAEKRGVVKAFDGLGDPTPTTVIDLRTDTMNVSDRGLLGLAVDPGWPARPVRLRPLRARRRRRRGRRPSTGTAGTDADPCPNCRPPAASSAAGSPGVRLDPATDLPVGEPHGADRRLVPAVLQPLDRRPALRSGRDALRERGRGSELQLRRLRPDRQPRAAIPANEGGALRAQDIRTTSDPLGYSGAVIRVSPDGGTPAIVAYGFRNPFRFAVRPGTSELWVGDVGWNAWEELDRIAAPDRASPVNFGWPCYEGAGRQPDYDALNKPLCETLYALGDTAWAQAVLDVQPRRGASTSAPRAARRCRASPSPPRAATTLPPTRAGSSSRTTRATASGTCRAGPTGCPTRRG